MTSFTSHIHPPDGNDRFCDDIRVENLPMQYRRVSYVVAQEHWGYELASELWERFSRQDSVALVKDEEHRQLMSAPSIEGDEELLSDVSSRSEFSGERT